MLRGSRSALAPDVVPETPLPVVPAVAAPVPAVPGVTVRSSTATFSGLGLVAQPARNAVKTTPAQSACLKSVGLSLLISISCSFACWLLFGQRAPCGLAHIAR